MGNVNLLEAILSSSLGIASIGWVYQSIKTRREKRDARIALLEEKLAVMDKLDTRIEESLKRVHMRVDSVETSQDKLENRIQKDIHDVKISIDNLTKLVLQAIKGKD